MKFKRNARKLKSKKKCGKNDTGPALIRTGQKYEWLVHFLFCRRSYFPQKFVAKTFKKCAKNEIQKKCVKNYIKKRREK